MAVPAEGDVNVATELVKKRIESVKPVAMTTKLSSTAQQLADGLAASKSRDSLWPVARPSSMRSQQYARVGSVITAVADMDTLDYKQLVGDYHPRPTSASPRGRIPR